jgi:membrane fusion protein, multidrug efflux system
MKKCLAGAMLAATLISACSHEEEYDKPLTPVRVEAVGRADGSSALRYSAAIVPVQAVPATFKVPGYIAEITRISDAFGGSRVLQEGDRVTAGQPLARIRPDDFQVKLTQARSQESEVEAAFAQADQAFKRATALYEKKSLTRGDYDAAKAAYDSVVARRAGVRAVIQEAGNALEDSILKSPLTGTIIKRLAEEGALVGSGTPGFMIADTSTVKVLFGAPEQVVRRLKRGQTQAVTTETYPNEPFEGRISNLATAADPGSLVFDIEVTIRNADGRLKPGMVASLELGGAGAQTPLSVPLAAVVRSPKQTDGYAVFVIENGGGTTRVKQREVTLGAMVSNGVAVTSGLRPGDQIVVSGAKIVADGEAVEILR